MSVWSCGLVLLVVLVAVTVETSHATSEWNQAARYLVLQIHNDLRRQEGGCHINKLEYDQNLENQARKWADKCMLRHELQEGRGENLAWNSDRLEESELIKYASDSWFNEKSRYSYRQSSCGSSEACHYTQMVWGNTNKIGCYSTRCDYLIGVAQDAWYLVCFYTPKGNWNKEKPYEKSCSSPCLEGQTVEDGLCVGEPVEAKKQDPVEEDECDDKVGSCAVWASNGHCEASQNYMKVHCQKSCNVCGSEKVCEDLHPNCAMWVSDGYCKTNPTHMTHNCKKSCGGC